MILIIANARRKGGLSGSDNIYLNLATHWAHTTYIGTIDVVDMMRIDFKPFLACYIWRILLACWYALFDKYKYEFVYSASDFWMDSLPGFIYKLKGNKWVAGFYMVAPKKKFLYWFTQQFARFFINRFADVICVTNETLFCEFPFKEKIAVHGGVDLKLAGPGRNGKYFDAVFVGRLHYTKGIDKLMAIWDSVRLERPKARLAIIGDGDSEREKISDWVKTTGDGVHWFGYKGEGRFEIYKMSKVVLYPVPEEYAHFSMGPVEAMACGCPMIAFNNPIMECMEFENGLKGCALVDDDNVSAFVCAVIDYIDGRYKLKSQEAIEWAKTWDWGKRAKGILSEIRSKII